MEKHGKSTISMVIFHISIVMLAITRGYVSTVTFHPELGTAKGATRLGRENQWRRAVRQLLGKDLQGETDVRDP